MKAQPLKLYLPDTRGVEISPFGSGNAKLGFGVFTYSRVPGRDNGTCPGSTDECEAICYAKRVEGIVYMIWEGNSAGTLPDAWQQTHGRQILVPEIPTECRLLRLHVGGDFDSVQYIDEWTERLRARLDVTCWAYTRSWRVASLLPALERLRTLSNVQLFASMDPSTKELPPKGWRRAWIQRKAPKNGWPCETRLTGITDDNEITFDGERSYVCPEETGRKANCAECGYCFEGQKHDVTFLEH